MHAWSGSKMPASSVVDKVMIELRGLSSIVECFNLQAKHAQRRITQLLFWYKLFFFFLFLDCIKTIYIYTHTISLFCA